MPNETFLVKKEMGYTHAEFLKKIPNLFGEAEYKIEGNLVISETHGQRVEIELSDERARVLSPIIRMPVTDITLRLSGFNTTEKNAFIKHFDLKYFKGGG